MSDDSRRAGILLFVFAAGAAFLTRLPFLGAGYGWDSDAWRMAAVARSIAATGRYAASRAPGYPVPECVLSLVQRGGPWAVNGATALMSALGVACFALTLWRLGAKNALLAALALASVPAFFIVSTTALDYAWALAFALAALLAAVSGRTVVAGVLTGLAIGSRLPSLVMIPPLATLIALGPDPAARLARSARQRIFGAAGFVAVALCVGAACFLPVALAAGPGFLHYYDHGYPALGDVVKKATVDLWGWPGAAAIAVAAAIGIRRGVRGDAPLALAWWIGLAAATAAYLSLPYKAAYLLPAVPFALLLLERALAPRWFRTLCLALIASPWLLHGYRPSRVEDPPPAYALARLGPAARPFLVDVRGPMLFDRARRERGGRFVDACIARAAALPETSVVVVSDWMAEIRMHLGGDASVGGDTSIGHARFVYSRNAAEARSLRAANVPFYYLPGVDEDNRKSLGVGVSELGGRLLAPAETFAPGEPESARKISVAHS